ncbi:MAG: TonB-dependent receptor, partial [Bryobacteraceae bacterium]
TAGSETVQTSGPEISTTITMDQIRRLPVLDRNPLAFLTTQAGVAATQAAGGTVNVNGQRESFTTMTLDGVSLQDNYLRDNDVSFSPNQLFLDQVQEVTIATSLSGADASGSSQVSFVTPSGTNQFHGSALWQNRNNDFAANDFFDNMEGNGLPRLNRNNLGGSLGGPIKRDKLFFYANYEYSTLRNQVNEDATILTASARAGIFKYIDTSGNLQSVPILQAANVQQSPAITSLLSQVPSPDKINNYLVGDSQPGQLLNTAGYGYLVQNNQEWSNVTGKLDYNLSTKNAIAATFAWNQNMVDRPDVAVSYSTTPPYFTNNNVKFAAVSWRWSPSATLTNELRGGLNYAPATFSTNQPLPSSFIGGLDFTTPVAAASFLPQGRDTRTRSIQDNATWVWRSHTFQFGYQYQGVRIRSYDYGYTAAEYDVTDPACNCVDSSHQNLLSAAQLPGISSQDLTNANNLLASLAGLLNDDAVLYNVTSRTSGFVPGAPWVRNYTYDNHALYILDKWKIRKNLTWTMGVRWDYYTPVNEVNSLQLQAAVVNNNPVTSLLSPNGTLVYTGNSVGNPFYQKDLRNFAPNAGLAWDVFGDGKTSVRAGYGMHYVDDQMVEVADGFTTLNPGLQAYPVNFDLSGTINSLPAIPVPPFQVPTSFATQYQLNPTVYFTLMNPHLQTPYDQQFGLAIQHEVKGTIIEVRYLGSHATELLRGFNVNQENVTSNGFLADFLKAQQNGNLALKATGTYNPAYNRGIAGSQPLPIFAQLQNGGYLSNSTNRTLIQNGEVAELAYQYTINGENGKLNFFPNPNALGAIYLTNFSNSEYNSGQVDVRRRFQTGLSFQVNYVFSKWLSDAAGVDNLRMEDFMDINNTALERSRTPTDLTHQFKANYAYDLPFGEGHALHLTHGLNHLIGGWTTSGNLSWVSGNPYSVYSGYGTFLSEYESTNNEAVTLLNNSQLNDVLGFRMTGNGPYMVAASAIGSDGRGVAPPGNAPFSGQVFYNPTAGNIGTLQRRQFTGPPIFEMDAAVFKDNKIKENVTLQLRMDVLNVFNHPGFVVSSGNMDINSQQFGKITQQANTSRELQFGANVRF